MTLFRKTKKKLFISEVLQRPHLAGVESSFLSTQTCGPLWSHGRWCLCVSPQPGGVGLETGQPDQGTHGVRWTGGRWQHAPECSVRLRPRSSVEAELDTAWSSTPLLWAAGHVALGGSDRLFEARATRRGEGNTLPFTGTQKDLTQLRVELAHRDHLPGLQDAPFPASQPAQSLRHLAAGAPIFGDSVGLETDSPARHVGL